MTSPAAELATQAFTDIIASIAKNDEPPATPEDLSYLTAHWWEAIYGERGGASPCTDWYRNVPGSFFQLWGLLMHIAFYASGSSSSAAMFNNGTCALAFLSLAVWGGTGVCGTDVIVWAVFIVLVNIGQVVYSKLKSAQTDKAFEGDQNKVYSHFFAPFEISRNSFTNLVGCKGFHIITLQKDHCYAMENKTTVDRLALLVSGKLRVHQGDKVLHHITKMEFIDSPEWDALRGSTKKPGVFRVTITAETTCRCIVWRRKPLLTLLSKEKQLNRILNCVIGQDIIKKLSSLNSKRFTERGFAYDVRLPCVISLRDEVEDREKRVLAQMTPNQAGTRSRKLGRRADQSYAKLFGAKLGDRLGDNSEISQPGAATSAE